MSQDNKPLNIEDLDADDGPKDEAEEEGVTRYRDGRKPRRAPLDPTRDLTWERTNFDDYLDPGDFSDD